jgi:hypothetical protein
MHAKHFLRAIGLLLFVVAAAVVARGFLVPTSYGEFGHYRGDNVQQQRDHAVIMGGRESCKDCHDEMFEEVMGNSHARVQCENCHGPVTEHARDDDKFADMPILREATLCLGCHEKLVARPDSFPQIDVHTHLQEMGDDPVSYAREVCLTCHKNPHAPTEDL